MNYAHIKNIFGFLLVLVVIPISIQANITSENCNTDIHSYGGNEWENVQFMVCSKESSDYSKPIVVIEGFDIGEAVGFEEIAGELSKIRSGTGQINMFQKLLNENYTIFLVNLPNSYQFDMVNTGKYVAGAMQNMWKLTRKAEPFKIIGISLGGVYGVMAADHGYKRSEIQFFGNYLLKINYKSDLLITLDTPHNGAFLPTSIQHFIHTVTYDDEFLDKTTELKEKVEDYNNLLNGPLAKQALILSVYSNNGSEFDEFQDNYDVIKSSLAQSRIRKVGIVSGSWNNKKQGTGTSVKMIDYQEYKWTKDVVGWKDMWAGPEINLWTQSSNPQNSDLAFRGRINFCLYKSECYDDPDISWNNRWDCAQFGTCDNYENASGGYLNLYSLVHDKLIEWKDDGSDLAENNGIHGFVPSYSAAAIELDNGMLDPNVSLQSLELTMGEMEKFSFLDKIYHQNDNLHHAQIVNKEMQDNILKEIHMAAFNPVPVVYANLLL